MSAQFQAGNRTYLRTHPWIDFQLDLRRPGPRLWMLLGEAQAKCSHIAGIPLLPEIGQEFRQIYLAKGARATTAIEGNTLTEEEVRRRIEGKRDLPPSREYLGQEVDNIIEACNLIADQILAGDPPDLCVETLKQYNALVLKNLPLDDGIVPGEIRRLSVGVGRYRGAPAEDCEYLVQRLCQWLTESFQAPSGLEYFQPAFTILKAIVAHLYVAWIHPFGDGNGRTARLIEFRILLAAGVPDTAAHLLSNHYNQTRTEYYRQLDRSHSVDGGDVYGFLEYALQGMVDGLAEELELVKSQQLRVHWRNYVYHVFRDATSQTDERRRRLILDLSDVPDPISMTELRHVSPRVAELYAGKSDKTLSRDVDLLRDMGLIVRTKRGIRANRELAQAFLPRTHPSS